MKKGIITILFLLLMFTFWFSEKSPALIPLSKTKVPGIQIGAKNFIESYLLGELLAQTIENAHTIQVERNFNLGGSGIVFNAIRTGKIDAYVDYTGTIAQALLKKQALRDIEDIRKAVHKYDLEISDPLGFKNNFALGVKRSTAKKLNLWKMSDLKQLSKLIRVGVSHEFFSRIDGYQGLKKYYELPSNLRVQTMTQSLAFEALADGKIDVTEVFTTDSKIAKLDLVTLEDDLHFFPEYQAVILARKEFVKKNPKIWETLKTLEGQITEQSMIQMNREVDILKKNFSTVISRFLKKNHSSSSILKDWISKLSVHTREHLYLVFLSVSFSTLVGIPLGFLAARVQILGQTILILSSLIQTIPSLALLCFLIPWFGIGNKPALVALFLYGLLPVVLNTYSGLKSIDSSLIETAKVLGLNSFQKIRLIELPLASRNIIMGVKTSVILGIGTTTLAALIGAGGYGIPIATGLAMNDTETILTGAIPAALMAVFAHFIFEVVGRFAIPKGLR